MPRRDPPVLKYLAFYLLGLVAPRLPAAAAYRLCDRIGDALFYLLPNRRSIVERNLAIVLGGTRRDLSRRARQVFREGVKYYYDTFRIASLGRERLAKLIHVEGWEHLAAAVAKGRGAIVFSAHLGSPALVSQILAVRGYRVTTVAELVRPPRLFDLLSRMRTGIGVNVVPLDARTTRELTEVLRRNEVVGIVVDRDVAGTGVAVDFFGVDARIPVGPAMLALRTGAALMPGFTYRGGHDRFTGYIGPPLEMERTGDLRRDLRVNTQKMARALEEAILRAPEQWVVFEPIWPERQTESGPGVDS